jgi:hypothetical protein
MLMMGLHTFHHRSCKTYLLSKSFCFPSIQFRTSFPLFSFLVCKRNVLIFLQTNYVMPSHNTIPSCLTSTPLSLTIMSGSLGFISISAITLLASPRPVNPQKGMRNIVFDANFFIVDGSQTSSLGLLRYFAPDNTPNLIQKFSQDTFQKAFIVATVRLSTFPSIFHSSHQKKQISSIPEHGISDDLFTQDLDIADYAFQGDILQVRDINASSYHHLPDLHLSSHSSMETSTKKQVHILPSPAPFPLSTSTTTLSKCLPRNIRL